jgi:uncharacterized membrane-anchored protein YitT (DUF2179 family)
MGIQIMFYLLHNPLKLTFTAARTVTWNLLLISAGSALCALAVNGILISNGFFGAGFAGIALLGHYLQPAAPVAAVYALINIPVFALGWKYVGRRFFLYSIAGAVIFSAALAWVNVKLPVYDQVLSALLAGMLVGLGGGIILRSLGSAGGLDILSVILLKRFSIRLGTTILVFNGAVLLCGALLFSLEKALYTMIYIYVNAHVVNLVVTGLSQRKAVYIISPQWEPISREIMNKVKRGVTIIEGHGAYSGTKEAILYTVITFRELAQLKRLIRDIDPEAFVVVTETLEVTGRRIGNQPHW